MGAASGRTSRLLTTAAGAGTGGAVLCAVCCVAPFALPAALVAGLGGALAWLGRLHSGVTIIAAALVLAAWLSVALQHWRSKKRPALSTVLVLGAATLALALAIAWPSLEPHIIRALSN